MQRKFRNLFRPHNPANLARNPLTPQRGCLPLDCPEMDGQDLIWGQSSGIDDVACCQTVLTARWEVGQTQQL